MNCLKTDFNLKFKNLLKSNYFEKLELVDNKLKIPNGQINTIKFIYNLSDAFFISLSESINKKIPSYNIKLSEIPEIMKIMSSNFYILAVYFEEDMILYKKRCLNFFKNILFIMIHFDWLKIDDNSDKETYYEEIKKSANELEIEINFVNCFFKYLLNRVGCMQ